MNPPTNPPPMSPSTSAAGRADLWLPLLRRLSAAAPSWYVWKNAESALDGRGDVDSAAPPEAWPAVEAGFRAWAADVGLRNVTACRHIPRTLNLVATSDALPDLLQLEVKGLTTLRGSALFRAEELLPLTLTDPQGFRRLRPGAEGLFKFITNGVRRGGAPDRAALQAKGVLEQIGADLDGMRRAAGVFGRGAPEVIRAVERALEGGWDRRALQRVELRAVLAALGEPHVLGERIWFRLARKPFCPLLKVVYREGRELPADVEAWLTDVARSHHVERRHAH